MKRLLISIFALFGIATIVISASQIDSSARSVTFKTDVASILFNSDPNKEVWPGEPTYDEMIMGEEEYNFEQDKSAPDKNVEAAKHFVGTWKGKPRPDMTIDAVFIFRMEGVQLKGMQRQWEIQSGDGSDPRIVRDEYIPLPELSIEGKTLSWKVKWIQPGQESLQRITLISEDEILFEMVGVSRSNTRPMLIVPISYKLKRER